jgi:hypothetical protein
MCVTAPSGGGGDAIGSLDIPARDIVLDLTLAGRGTDWYPKLEYPDNQ